MEREKKVDVSIVVPFYNEEKNIPVLYEEMVKVMRSTGTEYELVFVDDGSRDKTQETLKKLFDADPRVNVITLRRNFGQTAALAAGFDFARGDIIISMDGDLQHDPQEIPEFLGKIEEGFDIVSGWRKKRVDSFLTRRLPSLVANKIISILSGVRIHDFGTTFKAYRREAIKDVELSGDLHRFIPALASSMGVRITEIPIKNVLRTKGESKYGLGRILSVLYDFIIVKFMVSYLYRPMLIFGFFGLCAFIVGIIIALILTLGFYFFGLSMKENQGNLLLSVFLMLVGLQFTFTGVIAELCGRIYRKGTGQKIYSVKEIKTR